MRKLFYADFGTGSFRDRISTTLPNHTEVVMTSTEKGTAARFGATGDMYDYGGVFGVKTIAMIIRPTGDTKLLQDNGVDVLEISGGIYVASGMTATYVNNVSSTTAPSNVWQFIIAEFPVGVDFATDLEIGVTGSTDIAAVWMIDSLYTATQRENEYSDFQGRYHIVKPMVTNRGANDMIISWFAADLLSADNRIIEAGNNVGGLMVASGSVLAVDAGIEDSEEVLGANIIINGDFSSGLTDWVISGDWVVINEEASLTWNGTNSNIQQRNIPELFNIALWKLTYEIKETGDLNFIFASANFAIGDGSLPITVGVHELYLFSYGGFTFDNLAFRVESGTIGHTLAIDNISMKKVLSPFERQIVALENTTLQVNGIDLSGFTGNGWIKSLGGSLSSEAGQTVNDATNVSFTDNTLTITLTAGQTFTGIVITPQA